MIVMKRLTATFGLCFLLLSFPAMAATGLKVEVVTRDLAPETKVWLEVQPEFHQMALPATPSGTALDSGVPQLATGDSTWQFDASAPNASLAHEFSFPLDLAASSGQVGVIHLKARFRLDAPGTEGTPGYGKVHEVTLAMPVPAGSAALTRCLRLREAAGRLLLESAADCRDASFDNSTRAHLPPSLP
jgi:hypothetical protein